MVTQFNWVVETCVMRCKHHVFKMTVELCRNIFKCWRVFHHLITDPSQSSNLFWNLDARIDERFPYCSYFTVLNLDKCYFSDTIIEMRTTCSFNIQKD